MTRQPVTDSPWHGWRSATPARIALGRVGSGMPTDEVLRFDWSHAAARDAVHAVLDDDALTAALRQQQWNVVRVRSQARDRETYLRRPDLGRRLDPRDTEGLRAAPHEPCDLCIVIGDGLSALAVNRHAVPLLATLRPLLAPDRTIAPIVVAQQARVALADEVAELMQARLAVILIGERPGLSSPDSLGIYLTHSPYHGRADADRNCVSNIRPEGLSYDAAAFKLAWLINEALRRGVTGIALKDDSDGALMEHDAALATIAGPPSR